jgi:hypothetical protein
MAFPPSVNENYIVQETQGRRSVSLKRVVANDRAEPATSEDRANLVKNGRIICPGATREDDNTPSIVRTLQHHIPHPLCQRIAWDVLYLVV